MSTPRVTTTLLKPAQDPARVLVVDADPEAETSGLDAEIRVGRDAGAGEIVMMNEEHTVIRSDALHTGDRLLLIPEHTCTTAYLYSNALVRSLDGRWEYREQLGNERTVVALTR